MHKFINILVLTHQMRARKISLLFYSRQDVCDQTLCVDEDDDDDIAYGIRNMII